MASSEINPSSQTISSPQVELQNQQTNPFVGDTEYSPPQSTMPFRDLLREYRAGTLPCSDSDSSYDNWWEVPEADNRSSVGSTTRSSSPTASTTSTSYTSPSEQLVNDSSELAFGHIDYSDSEYSDSNGDGDDDDADDEDDDDEDSLSVASPEPSSYEDLFNMCMGPEPTKKRYASGWWENVGSRRSQFPISYTDFEESDRLPPLLEVSDDAVPLDPEPYIKKRYRSGWWEEVGIDEQAFPISYTNYQNSDRLPPIPEESEDDEIIPDIDLYQSQEVTPLERSLEQSASLPEQFIEVVSELTFDCNGYSDYSDSDYSGSDDGDDDAFAPVVQPPSPWTSYEDLSTMCVGLEPDKKRYASGWWEDVGSKQSQFPTSYTNFEESDRLPTLLEVSDDAVPLDPEPYIKKRYRSGWWEEVGIDEKTFPISYTNYGGTDRLPSIPEEEPEDDEITLQLCQNQEDPPLDWSQGGDVHDISSSEQPVDVLPELAFDCNGYSDYSGSEYSDSDDDDDDCIQPSPSTSYLDLSKMFIGQQEATKKRYASGWWEDVGSSLSKFPISYANFEQSDRLPSIEESEGEDEIPLEKREENFHPSSPEQSIDVSSELASDCNGYSDYSGSEYSDSDDDDDDCIQPSPSTSYLDLSKMFIGQQEATKQRYASGWWEDVGSSLSKFPISYANFEQSDRLPSIEESEGEDEIPLEKREENFHPSSPEQSIDVSSELVFDHIDYSDSDYSDSDNDDDDGNFTPPSPSTSYLDLSKMFVGQEVTKKRYASGWWESVGSKCSQFPISYTNYEESDRLPSIEEPEDEDEIPLEQSREENTHISSLEQFADIADLAFDCNGYSDSCSGSDSDDDDDFFSPVQSPSPPDGDLSTMCIEPEPTKKRYASGWWEDIGSSTSHFPISYTNFEESDRLPSLLEEPEDEDVTPIDPCQNQEEIPGVG